jgi:hypothetical protein
MFVCEHWHRVFEPDSVGWGERHHDRGAGPEDRRGGHTEIGESESNTAGREWKRGGHLTRSVRRRRCRPALTHNRRRASSRAGTTPGAAKELPH